MAKAKGTIVVGIVKFLRRHKEEAARVLPPDLQHYLTERIIPSAWYPEADLLRLIRARLELHPGPQQEVLEAMGRLTVQSHQEGVYAHLLGSGSVTSTSALWSSQHDTGTMTLSRIGDTEFCLELVGFALPSREMCAITEAYIAESVRFAGLTDLTIEKLACATRGGDRCTWRYTGRRADR